MVCNRYKKRLKLGEDEIEVVGDKEFVIEHFEKLRKEISVDDGEIPKLRRGR